MRNLFFLLSIPCFLYSASPQLIINPISIHLPTPTESDLDAGFVQDHDNNIYHAVKIEVIEGSPMRPWTLYLRAKNRFFSPTRAHKQVSDLNWKHNAEENNSYRTVTTSKTAVFSSPSGEGRRIKLDLSVNVNWQDANELYSLPLEFILEEN
ncbi:MAG: hypothetical protein CMO81_02120 [Waddliaceae bacterium]|nr:hypothetical protein [Waddliaceae bacterium]